MMRTLLLFLTITCSLLAEVNELTIEQNYLNLRAELLTKRQGTLLAANSDQEKLAISSRYTKIFNKGKTALVKELAESSALRVWIEKGDLSLTLPFDIIKFIEQENHTFVTYNTFTKPVDKRSIVKIAFRNGKQETIPASKNCNYTYKKEGAFGFRRTRPLDGGGVGSDVIKYNIFTNTFFKDNIQEPFMKISTSL